MRKIKSLLFAGSTAFLILFSPAAFAMDPDAPLEIQNLCSKMMLLQIVPDWMQKGALFFGYAGNEIEAVRKKNLILEVPLVLRCLFPEYDQNTLAKMNRNIHEFSGSILDVGGTFVEVKAIDKMYGFGSNDIYTLNIVKSEQPDFLVDITVDENIRLIPPEKFSLAFAKAVPFNVSSFNRALSNIAYCLNNDGMFLGHILMNSEDAARELRESEFSSFIILHEEQDQVLFVATKVHIPEAQIMKALSEKQHGLDLINYLSQIFTKTF